MCIRDRSCSIYGYLAVDHWCYTLVYESHIERHGAQEKTPLLGKKHYITLLRNDVQAQSEILKKDAVPLMVRWLDAGPEQEVATAAARALAKAAKGNKAVQRAICVAGAPRNCSIYHPNH